MKPNCWKLPLGHILTRLCSMSFHPQRTQSSLGYLSSFCIIHKWIGIQKVSILKHPSKSFWIVRPLSKAWLVKHMNMYVMCPKMNWVMLNVCQISKTLLLHKNPSFPSRCLWKQGHSCMVQRKGIHYLFMHFLQQLSSHNMKSPLNTKLQGCV